MAQIDQTYHQLCKAIIDNGYTYEDKKRGIKCKQLSSLMLDISLLKEFPLLTTKKMFTKGIVGELLWFLRGDSHLEYLHENNIHIWDKDAKNFSEDREVGRAYGVQWRDWISAFKQEDDTPKHVDQLTVLLENLKKSPMSRRHIVTAWNPGELDHTALPPCHWAFEIIVKPLGKLDKIRIHSGDQVYLNTLWDASVLKKDEDATSKLAKELEGLADYGFTLKWHQRSVDTFLGLPFNIASYALLAQMIEALTGYKALNIIGDLSNVHFYEPHIKLVEGQLKKDVNLHSGCGLAFGESFRTHAKHFREGVITFDEVVNYTQISDITFPGYDSFPAIKAEMFEPKQ